MKRIFLLLNILILTSFVNAGIITVEFEAEITHINDLNSPFPDYVAEGAIIEGCYVYDSDVSPIINPNTNNAIYQYDSAPYGMAVKFINPNDENDYVLIESDPSNVDFRIIIGPSGTFTAGSNTWACDDFSLPTLFDFSLKLWSAIEPADNTELFIPDLENYQGNNLYLYGKEYSSYFQISANITSIVPEPSIISMVVIGTIGIIKRRKR